MPNPLCSLHSPSNPSLVSNDDILPMFSLCFSGHKDCQSQLLCSMCEHPHKSKLTLEEILLRLERLVQVPHVQVRKQLAVVCLAIEKFKYIEQFKNSIMSLENEVIGLMGRLVESSQKIVQQQTRNKKQTENIIKHLLKIDDFQQISALIHKKNELFAQLTMPPPQSKKTLQLSNPTLTKQQNQSDHLLKTIHKKYSEIKEYCIKIVEVVVQPDEDELENQSLGQITKLYKNYAQYLQNFSKKTQLLSACTQTEGKWAQNDQKNRYLYEIEKKVKKVQDRFMVELEQLSEENKKLRTRNEQLKTMLKKKKDKEEGSQSSTINSDRQVLLGKLLTLYDRKV